VQQLRTLADALFAFMGQCAPISTALFGAGPRLADAAAAVERCIPAAQHAARRLL